MKSRENLMKNSLITFFTLLVITFSTSVFAAGCSDLIGSWQGPIHAHGQINVYNVSADITTVTPMSNNNVYKIEGTISISGGVNKFSGPLEGICYVNVSRLQLDSSAAHIQNMTAEFSSRSIEIQSGIIDENQIINGSLQR